MNWSHFQTYNEAPTKAFECMCNQLFQLWCKKTYCNTLKSVTIVNGAGGDGGVEAYAVMEDESIIGVQAKWFPSSITVAQFRQIERSVKTAMKIRPAIKKYIVCVPRDLSNKRSVSKEKIAKNDEQTRWEELKNLLKEEFEELEIELWNETRLSDELQASDAGGIHRYWFEKSEITREIIVQAYNKQKSGWLSYKYIPCLHTKGKMEKNISKFVGNLDERKKTLNIINEQVIQYNEFLIHCNDFLEFLTKFSAEKQVINEIKLIQQNVNALIIDFNNLKEHISLEKSLEDAIYDKKWVINFNVLIDLLDNSNVNANDKTREYKKNLNKVIESNNYRIISNIKLQFKYKKYLVLGNPGSGKTHGIANLIESLVQNEAHIPILVRAKEINPCNSWSQIIKKVLGLASDWNEIELWQALEALSYRIEVKNMSGSGNDSIKVIPKILICIEGVDESRPYDLWHERLLELDAICQKYSRVRICITSRPHVFRGLTKDNRLMENVLNIPMEGDVRAGDLFDKYVNYYNIKMQDNLWIKWSIKTPLALRVFCDIYKNETVGNIQGPEITITNLLKKRFSIMEKEFTEKYDLSNNGKDYIVHSSLLEIAKIFLARDTVEREELFNLLKDLKMLNQVKNDYRSELLQFIEDYGIIQSFTVNSNNIFQVPKTYYSTGIQPFFDYLLALLVTQNVKEPSEIVLSQEIISNEGALQMVALILLEKYHYLVKDNIFFRENLNNDELFDLVCFALANASKEPVAMYTELVRKMMNNNAECLKRVVNNLILPVCRINNHPFNAMFLHEFLKQFETACSTRYTAVTK